MKATLQLPGELQRLTEQFKNDLTLKLLRGKLADVLEKSIPIMYEQSGVFSSRLSPEDQKRIEFIERKIEEYKERNYKDLFSE